MSITQVKTKAGRYVKIDKSGKRPKIIGNSKTKFPGVKEVERKK